MGRPRLIVILAATLGTLGIAAGCESGSGGPRSATLPATMVGQEIEPESPDNAPLTVSVEVTPLRPRVGEEVVFNVRAVDPDAEVLSADHCTATFHWFGDEDAVPGGCTPGCASPAPDRPPPQYEPRPGLLEEEYRHVYEEPGTYRAHFSFSSRAGCSSNPYGSTGAATVVVPVQP